MSGPPERPWTEEEKVRAWIPSPLTGCIISVGDILIGGIVTQYALFTEILKKAEVPSAYLYNIIRDFRISPRWGDIPLPSGKRYYFNPLSTRLINDKDINP